jgi:hypothetical protein
MISPGDTSGSGTVRPGHDDPDPILRIRSPEPIPVLIGLCIVASMYLFPLFSPPRKIGSPLTLADLAVGGSAAPFPGNLLYLISFIMGWGVAIGLVAFGLLNTKPDLSFERE